MSGIMGDAFRLKEAPEVQLEEAPQACSPEVMYF